MKKLSDFIKDEQTKIFKKYKAFFAFDKQRFNEHKEDDVIYVSLGIGLFVPKENSQKLIKELDSIRKNGIKQDILENGKCAIIKRELSNYEAQISMCINDTVEALDGYGFSRDDIEEEYKKYFKYCVKNDLF